MINASKDKLASFFQGNNQFVVPFFQRAYVWEEENWITFWEHVFSVFEQYKQNINTEHFIGTIITKQLPLNQLGLQIHELIDGQQRLTTVALFLKAIMDSSKGEIENLGNVIDAKIQFKDSYGKQYYRIRPSSNDQYYFDAILSNNWKELSEKDHKIIKAYKFFRNKLDAMTDEERDLIQKILLERVSIISMMLAADDDEQEIFDTINALGVRLTTAELLKNFIFKEKDIQSNFEEHWHNIYEVNDDQVEFWGRERTAGRVIRTNIEVLLYCYLVIKTGKEVKMEKLFKEYKDWLKDKTFNDRMSFLKDLKKYAEIYFEFPSGSDLNEISFDEYEKRFFHVIDNLMVTTIIPLVLYIYRNVSVENERKEMLRILENYIVRRNICRLTSKNYNLLFVQILNKLDNIKEKGAVLTGQVILKILLEFDDETNRLPNDQEIVRAFHDVILSNQNSREILFLIAMKQASGNLADMPKMSLANYSVEHIMPVKWEKAWSEMKMTPDQKSNRYRVLKTLGNLTLVTKRLNSKLQNEAWSKKKEMLKMNSTLPMTVKYLEKPDWEEKCIFERAGDLANVALSIWVR